MNKDGDVPTWEKNPPKWAFKNKEGNVHSNTVWMRKEKGAAIRVPESEVTRYESNGYHKGRK
jgi:hypothetical protein